MSRQLQALQIRCTEAQPIYGLSIGDFELAAVGVPTPAVDQQKRGLFMS